MSYARWGTQSDVYLFESIYGVLECTGCLRNGSTGFSWISSRIEDVGRLCATRQTLQHLDQHRRAGDQVPAYAYTRLFQERHMTDEQLYGGARHANISSASEKETG